MHAALDKFAFIAVTGSLETLNKLIDLVKQENDRWQQEFDEGFTYNRRIPASRVHVSISTFF